MTEERKAETHLVLISPTPEDVAYAEVILSKFTHQEFILKKLAHMNPTFITMEVGDLVL